MLAKVLTVLLIIWSTNASLNDRLDCHLENDFKVDQKSCEERGCIWDSEKRSDDVPLCYLDTKKIGYKIVKDIKKTETGLEIDLELKDTARSILKKAKQIENLKVEITFLTNSILRVKVVDPKNSRYEVPFQKNFPLLQNTIKKIDENNKFYSIEINENKNDFSFSIIRKTTKTKVFDTSIGGLIYSDQLLQMATHLPSKNVYGLGENTHHSLRHKMINYTIYPLFAQDHETGQDDLNLYGVHPFYTVLEANGNSHGVLLLNSNAMDVTLLPEPALSFKTFGGVLDFFIIVGNNPGQVIELYTSLIGRPTMPPFWGLGFQLSRWGHPNTSEVESVINRNIKANIPLDIMYMDSDYMNNSRIFSYDHKNFEKLPELINQTKTKHNLRWTLIIDPGVEGSNNPQLNPPFTDGYKKDVFIKWDKNIPKDQRYNPSDVPLDTDIIYGKVWPDGPVAFPDFFKNKTHEWWTKGFHYLYNDLNIKFDALWIDMNEIANQNDFRSDPKFRYNCPQNKYDYPEFRIKSDYMNEGYKNLSHKTVCMVAVQGENSEYLEYNVHSLYGLSETIATQKAIHSVTGKRGFAVSRSTYVSSGRYGTHWLGDNRSAWPHIKYSIIGTMEMNLFGIPFVGPDICGFLDNTTPEMCKRWGAVGAFFPFSRNHNCRGNIDQDPGVWAERGHPEVTDATRNSLKLRYQLLPYFYTLFYRAHTYGSTVVRPLFHEFSTDEETFSIDEQFMLGYSVLISPFLYEKQKEVKAYLPNDVWYDVLANMTKVEKTGHVTLADNKYGIPPIHLRGGSIIPVSSSISSKHITTEDIRKGNISLLVLPGAGKTAFGDLFWDDGDSIDTIENNEYNYYSINLEINCSLDIKVIESGYHSNQTLETITIYGTNGDKVEATLDGKPVNAVSIDGELGVIVKINLNSKKAGDKWTLKWKSTKTNSCNFQ